MIDSHCMIDSRYLRTLEKQRVLDEQELESMMADRGRFLSCALSNYLKCLQFGDRHDMRVFRVTSLWFDNASQSEINDTMQKGADQIKSCKFLPLMYQLAARMGVAQPHNPSLFYSTLNSLIERVVLDHPHHSLFIILALANANKDSDVGSERSTVRRSRLSKSSSNSEEEPEAQQGRMQAAVNMLERLRQSRRADILRDMENLCDAYIELANWDVTRYKTETSAIKLPSGALLTKLNNLETVAMPTLTTKIDPTGVYADVVHIRSFESTFKLAGGINLPKIITCLGSDGVSRRQLVKGKDDLRQDAVMQQVFEMVNDLLQRDTESSRRHLKVRTYKVIPLSQRSGLLEWCEGTIPLGSYLCGGVNGAHERYRPQDLTACKCRKRMMAAVEKNYKRKHEAYLSLCDNFRPVFRHFFMERFPEPGDWYEKRLAYTRSVATNSIVGYIVGLGDRHVQNILIDCKTAELVHIDLGVAFEQGKILPTPETVPFRLTRDIVDGMGVAGVNGVFRRQKLQGLEDSVQLSVSGQVNQLIQAALDPKNLCRLFPGWQPYI
ncbi:hypothetical protein NP493_226g01000 [Ridgeia piscesae]|uniref:non-specific serine/threonine protein kinase n=1 Tax=Ridgeia piscesae TaxID=27915 RepID=A0AAD9P0A0_RIDPI|nr:hypothetical protein NP493_226g01000 [Ridgeia piscesae]